MVVGLILSIALLFAFPYILKLMNIDITNSYSPKQVFVRAGELLQKLTGLKEVIQKSQLDNQYRGNLYYKTTDGSSTDMTLPSSSEPQQ